MALNGTAYRRLDASRCCSQNANIWAVIQTTLSLDMVLRSVQLDIAPVVAQFRHSHQSHLDNDSQESGHLFIKGWFPLKNVCQSTKLMSLRALLHVLISWTNHKTNNFVRDEVSTAIYRIERTIFWSSQTLHRNFQIQDAFYQDHHARKRTLSSILVS